jgi:SAM-dependent methyltransferase
MMAILEGLGYPNGVDPLSIKTDLSRLGLGISDDWRLARRISQVFYYTNSFYHRFPVLDVMNPPEEAFDFFEFVSCSDVLEHTPPPTTKALAGLLKILKPGGFVVVTVPCSGQVETNEYYPGLKDCFIKDNVLFWWDESGVQHRDENPEYHGGEGQTIAFRHWSRHSLIEECKKVGFSTVYSPMNLPPIAEQNNNAEHAGIVIARR